MSVLRIEIIAVGEKRIYSVGAVCVSRKGDVYFIHKTKNSQSHLSKHSSGEMHWKLGKNVVFTNLRKRPCPIEDFRGIDFLTSVGFGLESLPQLHKEYKMKKCDGIFAIDMRNYANSAFNMSVAMLTEEGLPRLYEAWKMSKKRQIFIYTDSHPMIAITAAAWTEPVEKRKR